jgi:hypothetical protein
MKAAGLTEAGYNKGNILGGKQIENRESKAKAEIQHAAREPLPVVWPAAGRVPQVWHLSHLFPQTRGSGIDPRSA